MSQPGILFMVAHPHVPSTPNLPGDEEGQKTEPKKSAESASLKKKN